MKLTDTEVADLLKSERPWNIARRAFEKHMALISILIDASDGETLQEISLDYIAIRRAEFEAVEAVGRALGVVVGDRGVSGKARSDPEGLREWLGKAPSASPGAPEAASPNPAKEAPRDRSGARVAAPAGKPPLGPENVD